ncbi:hypothetical protein [Hydrogenivirga sp. 128-5-R1-1]|uniref:hypothetical protein n=1 Tax=Hydrogenivirga sp. 128-5-R1-1 TaxID=392423 RepID=UPI00015F3384|nr:hypothetical protein [Hydrogenivirga sp. 128-5-R1-1]EDP74823.1 hypothetical protein HG1285_13182 [Hydrogenivirga sp. 128-5-R1-1]
MVMGDVFSTEEVIEYLVDRVITSSEEMKKPMAFSEVEQIVKELYEKIQVDSEFAKAIYEDMRKWKAQKQG